ncbi:Protein-disulfide isomerase [Octadecabacter temperatus]|uniref:Disulfide bond formation protein D n=1 Tax=Octadecabacter temperatus TaxID=1458307 RepID=A0A0K0Y9F8_9RHOB|nr:DsbA family protein [Octadecabacter temperatus]AKS47593.1 Disulfide bond formation protein D precursor [Octadecabacter temperatus]SIO40862.1 Protein-disulfide isomerase [Octadecabacter temperatus]
MNKSVLTSVAAVAIVAIAGGAWFMNRSPANADIAPVEEAAAFDVVEMIQGNPDAAVQVVEYASYTCPHCANFHADQYPQIKENYIDTGLIGFTYREVYFDQPGLWASMVARCGGEMRFFGISNLLYENQQDWARAGDGAAIAQALRNIGKVAGLSDEELDVCMTDADQAQTLMAWYRTNGDADNVQGTPTFRINGEEYSNMTYADFAEVLDEKLAEAN